MTPAPFPVVTCDPALNVVEVNPAARLWLGEAPRLSELLPADAQQLLRDDGAERLRTVMKDHYIEIRVTRQGDFLTLWMIQLDEQRHLEEQLKKLKRPDRKLVRHLASLVATIRSQGELVSVMLEHGNEFSLDQLKVIRGCQSEINAKLAQCETLIDNLRHQRQGSGASESGTRVLVCHTDATRAELIGELLQLDGLQVDGFTSIESASRFAEANGNSLGVAIVMDDVGLKEQLLDVSPAAHIIVLATPASLRDDARVQWFDETPLDINELQALVAKLLDGEL